MHIEKLVIFGGTHGNEWTGIEVLKILNVKKLEGESFEIEGYFSNPLSFDNKKRYIQQDLNRSFTKKSIEGKGTLVEEVIAKEIYDKYATDKNCLIDLHTTTANMGKSIVLTNKSRFNLHLIKFLKAKHKDLNVFYWAESEDLAFLNSICPNGFAIETGPVANNVADPVMIEMTLELVEDIAEYITLVNNNLINLEDGVEVEVFEKYEYVDYIKNEEGERITYLHRDLIGKDFSKLIKGDKIFSFYDGGEVLFDKEGEYYPVFINEAAYYEKGIAFCITKKITLK